MVKYPFKFFWLVISIGLSYKLAEKMFTWNDVYADG